MSSAVNADDTHSFKCKCLFKSSLLGKSGGLKAALQWLAFLDDFSLKAQTDAIVSFQSHCPYC
jgi:hypothetical protein